MKNLESNYFIDRLEKGINTKIMLMAHNAYWFQLKKFEKIYSNFEVKVFGSSTAYLRMRKNDIPNDCDFIILDSSNFYSEDDFLEIKKIALKMSCESNKRVSIGYVYFIPLYKRTEPKMSNEIKIVSFKNNNFDETIIPLSSYDLLSLADIIVNMHNELENHMILKKM